MSNILTCIHFFINKFIILYQANYAKNSFLLPLYLNITQFYELVKS